MSLQSQPLWRQSSPEHHVVNDPNTTLHDLATKLIQVITTNADLTPFTALGPYHILKMPFKSKWIRQNTIAFHFSGNSTTIQNIHTKTRHQISSLISILVSLILSVLPKNDNKTNYLKTTYSSLPQQSQ
jgi:Txe/YoeB family toxin of Txe-Axe toxin-antitoxin module